LTTLEEISADRSTSMYVVCLLMWFHCAGSWIYKYKKMPILSLFRP